jgi:hypothetical protein
MYKITVLCIFDPLSKMDDSEMALPTEYETSSKAELRALRWLLYRPNDIVMLVFIPEAQAA